MGAKSSNQKPLTKEAREELKNQTVNIKGESKPTTYSIEEINEIIGKFENFIDYEKVSFFELLAKANFNRKWKRKKN